MKTRAGLLVLSIVALGGTTVALAQQHHGGGGVRHGGGGDGAHPDAGSAAASTDAGAPTAHASADAGAATAQATGHGAHAGHGDAGALASNADASAAAPARPTTTFDLPMNQRGTGAITHYPVPEQLARNDIPVFVQVHSSAPLDHVSLFYRGAGARRYRELRMAPMGQNLGLPGGYGAQVPCEDAFPPAVEYYVEALATSGVSVGSAGTAAAPISLPVVINRTRPIVPTLPGQPPPRSCGTLESNVASQSTSGGATSSGHDGGGAAAASSGTADLGEPCTQTSDCHHGLRCGSNHLCVFVSNH